MLQSTTTKVLVSLLMVFLVTGFVQAQFLASISGKVTFNDEPMAEFGIWVSSADTTGRFPVWTNSEGNYVIPVVPGTYTLSTVDTFSFEPMQAEVVVESLGQNVVQNFVLMARTDLVNVSGTVTFEGNPVQTPVYFLKIADDTNLDDFRQIEVHYNIPVVATRWASYSTMTSEKGAFVLGMLAGKYVVYIPAGENSLSFWAALEITGETTLDPFVLQKMTTISGTISNTDDYDNVMVYAHPTDARRPFMTFPNENGEYTIDVAPGEYVVRVLAFFEEYMYSEFYTEGDDPAYLPKDATPLQVDENGLTDINFTLPDAAVYDFTVKGMVSSAQSGKPIAGANVNFVSTNVYFNLWRSYSDSTDENGMYEINGKTILLEDSLIGFAWAENFFAEFYNNKATFQSADPIVYQANSVIEGINFELDTLDTENNFSISGMVYDDKGYALTSGIVTAYTTATNVGVITTQIGEDGSYAFDSVFPTNSTVYVQAWSWGYLPEFYNEAEGWDDADAITIGTENVTGINFTLTELAPTRLPLALIRGSVSIGGALAKAAGSASLDGATVYVRAEGTTKWSGVDFIDAKGSFELPVETNGNYELKVSANGYKDKVVTVSVEDFSGSVEITLEPTAINPKDEYLVTSHRLYNAYPNPFNPTTTIEVEMAATVQASLIVYNVIGQKVKTLHNGILSKGLTRFNWNGTDDSNNPVASGLYFYQLKTKSTVSTKTVMFIK